jgi:chorismate-pyruvate lyase
LTEVTPPADELESLIALFYPNASQLGNFTQCDSHSMPLPYQQLLAHEAHMTVTVEQRHGCEVTVEVLESEQVGNHYIRKILLRKSTDHRVVQYGIVRLALDTLDAAPRDEILARQTPLGRVLIKHNVLRQVQLLAVWRVICGPELANYFEVEQGHETYGRTALIYCNGEPAVELLEIVAPEAG